MEPDQIATFVVVGAAFTLFVTEWLPVDVTAVLIPIAFGVLGILEPKKALEGFGNPAVVTVAGMFVLSRALVQSGAVSAVGSLLQRLAAGGERRALLAIVVIVAACSAFINNTPVVIVFLPMVLAVAADVRLAPSRLLIPLSYASILGGCCTLIGTSTTVLVSAAVVNLKGGERGIGFFEPLPFGLIAVLAGSAYLIAFGPKLLPIRRTVTTTAPADRPTEYVTEVSVLPGSPLAGKSIEEAILTPHPELAVVEIVRHQEILWPGTPGLTLQEGDLLLVRGKAEAVMAIGSGAGAELLPELGGQGVRGRDVTLAELVIPAGSPLVGRTVREAAARALPGSTVMAVERRGSHLRAGIADLVLREADTLLVQTEASRLPSLRGSDDFVLLEELHEKLTLRKKAPLVLVIALAVVALASLEIIDIALLAAGAAVALVASGCLPPRLAYRALDMPTLVLLGATISIGVALNDTGAAALVASEIMRAARTLVVGDALTHAHVALALCYLLANMLTAFASNAASALLVLPIAIRTAHQLDVSDRPFIMAVVFAASLDFSTPIGYQTNLLVYGPGGYKFRDYVRVGLPLNLGLFVLAVLLLPYFYPF